MSVAIVPETKTLPTALIDSQPPGVSPIRRFPVLLVLAPLGLFLFFYGLNTGELYRTESLRAILAADMLRSGNWIVPTLYDQPLLTKPPGMYWAIALVSLPFGGVSEWSARLPSALAASISVLLFFWYFRRQLGSLGGFLVGLILPLSVMWLDKVPSAEIDMLQLAWVAAALLFAFRAIEPASFVIRHSSFVFWLLALVCVAGGVLTKWTAPIFFYGTLLPLLWWRGRLRVLVGWQHILAAAAGAGLCLAWGAAAIHQVGWDSFRASVEQQGLTHLAPGQRPKPYAWGEALAHPFVLFAANLPWSIFALWTLRPSFFRLWDERGRFLLQALHCWLWPNLLFWSIAPGHSPRHSFPLCPAFAGLAAMVWYTWLCSLSPWRLPIRPAKLLVMLVVMGLAAKLVFVEAVVPARQSQRQPCAKGELLAQHVLDGKPLYLFRVKDEGIMFYYSRAHPLPESSPPVRRLQGPAKLPLEAAPNYCILESDEWRQWPKDRPGTVVLSLTDEQEAPMVLVCVP
jgi:4-amino-4-deoxy-L-arabinose transferase-like glycosyltransferase